MCNASDTSSDGSQHSKEIDDIEYIRAKWTYDGASTIDEIIEKLYGQIEHMRKLKEEGWELIDKVEDDYGPMRKSNSQVAG